MSSKMKKKSLSTKSKAAAKTGSSKAKRGKTLKGAKGGGDGDDVEVVFVRSLSSPSLARAKKGGAMMTAVRTPAAPADSSKPKAVNWLTALGQSKKRKIEADTEEGAVVLGSGGAAHAGVGRLAVNGVGKKPSGPEDGAGSAEPSTSAVDSGVVDESACLALQDDAKNGVKEDGT